MQDIGIVVGSAGALGPIDGVDVGEPSPQERLPLTQPMTMPTDLMPNPYPLSIVGWSPGLPARQFPASGGRFGYSLGHETICPPCFSVRSRAVFLLV